MTVRRALELVREEGLIAARQGFGWFVATEPVRQRLDHLGTIEDQLDDSGAPRRAAGDRVRLRDPPERVRKVLGVEQVLRVKRVNLADGEPFAVVTVWCPAELGASAVPRATSNAGRSTNCSTSSCAAPPRRSAPTPPRRPTPSCSASRSAAPLLRCQRVTTDTAGRPVLMSEHLFPAHRTEFVVELPLAEPSTSPAGLRLVE